MTSPTFRQLEVLRFLHGYTKRNGYPPTIREIGEHMGISSTNGVGDHLRFLEAKGLVSRTPKRSRTLVATPKGLLFLKGVSRERTA